MKDKEEELVKEHDKECICYKCVRKRWKEAWNRLSPEQKAYDLWVSSGERQNREE